MDKIYMDTSLFLKVKWKRKLLSCIQLCVTPWTVARQAPLSMEFSRPEHWSGLPFPSPGDLPDSGIKVNSLPAELPGKPKVKVTQLCPTLCGPMDCSLPGSSVHGILQARILEQIAIPFSRGSSWPKDQTQTGRFFTLWATREAWTNRKTYHMTQSED